MEGEVLVTYERDEEMTFDFPIFPSLWCWFSSPFGRMRRIRREYHPSWTWGVYFV
jgi:hypothetical protein